MTIQTIAGEALSFFVTKYRDGTPFWTISDNSPDWLRTLVYAAHGEFIPDDWRYNFIHRALNSIDDDGDEATAPEPDVYTHELTGWLHSRADRYGYCDTAQEEFGPSLSLLDTLTRGQFAEIQEVFESVYDSLQSHLAELGTSDPVGDKDNHIADPSRRLQ